MLKVIQISVLEDNYSFIIHNNKTGETAAVDPALEEPILKVLKENNWSLSYIINTHHHWDHTDANVALKGATGAKIMGYKHDAHRIPAIDILLEDNDVIEVCSRKVRVIFVPGHTLGHIVYYFEEDKILFVGDTIFSLGSGRLFEGSYQQMFNSLQRLKSLPEDVLIYCAHEYTQDNGKFAITVDPNNEKLQGRIKEVEHLRENNKATVPTNMKLELETNPFLRARSVEEFAYIRKQKDVFKA